MLARSPAIDPEMGISAIASPRWFLLVFGKEVIVKHGYSHESICECVSNLLL